MSRKHFYRGALSAFEVIPSKRRYQVADQPNDWQKLSGDWLNVAKDMSKAMNRYEQKRTPVTNDQCTYD